MLHLTPSGRRIGSSCASRRTRYHRCGQSAATADPAHQRYRPVGAVRRVPGDRRHQFADHPQRLGGTGEVDLAHRGRADAHPVESGVPGLRHCDRGPTVRDIDRTDRRPPVETPRRLRGGGVHRRAGIVDHRRGYRSAALAFRRIPTPVDGVVAVPRRPSLDCHAGGGVDGVGTVAARPVATVVVDAATGVRAYPSRRQRRRAGAQSSRACGGLVRRRPDRPRCRDTGPRGATGRRHPGTVAARLHHRCTDGGASGRTRPTGTVRRRRSGTHRHH